MAHNISETQSSASGSDFLDCMQRADDFMKIELLRQAKSWYTKALEFNIETERVKARIAECNKMLAFENKVVGILVSIAFVLVIFYLAYSVS